MASDCVLDLAGPLGTGIAELYIDPAGPFGAAVRGEIDRGGGCAEAP